MRSIAGRGLVWLSISVLGLALARVGPNLCSHCHGALHRRKVKHLHWELAYAFLGELGDELGNELASGVACHSRVSSPELLKRLIAVGHTPQVEMRSLNQHRELRRERLAKGASGHDRWSPRLATTPPLCIKRYPGCAIACSVKGVIRISKEAAMHGNMIVMHG